MKKTITFEQLRRLVKESNGKLSSVSKEIEKAKTKLKGKIKRGGMKENFGEDEYRRIKDKFVDTTDYSKDGKKIRDMVEDFRDWCSKQPMDESKSVKESDDPEKGKEVFVIDVLDLTGMEDEDESEIPDTIYSETFDDEDEAWNKAEDLVEQYKDKEGKFEVFVNAGIYRTPDGDEDSTDMYSIFYMLSGTEGYQGHINMVESKSKKRVKESAKDNGESMEMSVEIADEDEVDEPNVPDIDYDHPNSEDCARLAEFLRKSGLMPKTKVQHAGANDWGTWDVMVGPISDYEDGYILFYWWSDTFDEHADQYLYFLKDGVANAFRYRFEKDRKVLAELDKIVDVFGKSKKWKND